MPGEELRLSYLVCDALERERESLTQRRPTASASRVQQAEGIPQQTYRSRASRRPHRMIDVPVSRAGSRGRAGRHPFSMRKAPVARTSCRRSAQRNDWNSCYLLLLASSRLASSHRVLRRRTRWRACLWKGCPCCGGVVNTLLGSWPKKKKRKSSQGQEAAPSSAPLCANVSGSKPYLPLLPRARASNAASNVRLKRTASSTNVVLPVFLLLLIRARSLALTDRTARTHAYLR